MPNETITWKVGSPKGIEVYVLALDANGNRIEQQATITHYAELREYDEERGYMTVFVMKAVFVAVCAMTPFGWRYRVPLHNATYDAGIASIDGPKTFRQGDIIDSDCRCEIS